ncbi:MAG: TIM barrel protein [Bryobacteraceae bacterium]|nr:TIM barrel protein [Bryobacteraceae bacterium]
MLRRTLLTLPLAAAVPRFQLSVRVEALFPGVPLADCMRRVADAGYQGFEFGDWRSANAREIVALKDKLRLTSVSVVGNRGVNPLGMGLCDPAERDGFLAEIRASTEAARAFEASQIVVLTGFKIPGVPRERQRASVVEGLKRAHDIVAPHGVTIAVEPINTLAPVEPLNPKGDNHARYFLDRSPEAFAIAREAGSPFVKILYDLYHAQIMDGNLIETIRANIGAIAHFHVGDVPGRHEPGTGEIHYPNVFRAIRDTGYSGFVGMEYVPSKDAATTLRNVRKMVESL